MDLWHLQMLLCHRGAWAVESGWSQSWLTITLGLRHLNTSLWTVGQSKSFVGIREELQSWATIMFPPEPPPARAQPKPCVPALQCLPKYDNNTLNFTLRTSVHGLCTKSEGSQILFTGRPCSAGGSTSHADSTFGTEATADEYILWEHMKTLDPRAGKSHAECEWSREKQPNDISRFFGQCGVCPLSVALPTTIC